MYPEFDPQSFLTVCGCQNIVSESWRDIDSKRRREKGRERKTKGDTKEMDNPKAQTRKYESTTIRTLLDM